MVHRPTLVLTSALLVVTVACGGRRGADSQPAPDAESDGGPDSGPDISLARLRARLYAYADDSMEGRLTGQRGDVRATRYIAAAFRRIGLEPAGDSGGYFQTVPLIARVLAPGSVVSVDGSPLTAWTDYAPRDQGPKVRRSVAAAAVYGGVMGTDPSRLIAPERVAGKVVVFTFDPSGPSFPLPVPRTALTARYAAAAAIAMVNLEKVPPVYLAFFRGDAGLALRTDPAPGDTVTAAGFLYISTPVARRMFDTDLASLAVGTAGRPVSVRYSFIDRPPPYPARNVVALLRGSDPALRGEYVAIGAHNDHIGMLDAGVDHDSLRAYNQALRDLGAVDPFADVDSGKRAAIRVAVDSLHRIHPARRDSINNGADDDGSGTVSLLEIARSLVRSPDRPKRSILFVSHTGEELGLFGSVHFTDHPTVPRDSIVAQLNIDMIGRGDSADIVGGGPRYVQLVGSRRLSTELGDLAESVNRTEPDSLAIDYQFDAAGHPEQIYCRSDHYSYARYGIPIVFVTTGQHRDYHQVTDEPQYIDYDHMARVARFVRDLAVRLADLDHRVIVDKPKPDPHGECKQ
jgi:peptidase M28-like protein